MTDVAQRESTGRVNRLRASLANVRSRGNKMPVERMMAFIGAALVGIGIPLIILGWYGAAHTPYTFEQIPYMISGGLLGLALTILGGLFYFAYWMTRQVHETRRQSDQTEQVYRRIERIMSSNGHGADGSVMSSTPAMFVASARGSMFHRPDCVVVKGRPDVRAVTGEEKGLRPCKICDPLAEEAPADA
ncbi:MAG TPA: hypothetical protein VGW79_04645 [Actinomycetota bacterium]|nr:hypothetical protein [Actinomycetota bacterium]